MMMFREIAKGVNRQIMYYQVADLENTLNSDFPINFPVTDDGVPALGLVCAKRDNRQDLKNVN